MAPILPAVLHTPVIHRSFSFKEHSELAGVWCGCKERPEAFQPTPRANTQGSIPGAGWAGDRQGKVGGNGQEGAEGDPPQRKSGLQPKSQSPTLSFRV